MKRRRLACLALVCWALGAAGAAALAPPPYHLPPAAWRANHGAWLEDGGWAGGLALSRRAALFELGECRPCHDFQASCGSCHARRGQPPPEEKGR